jgi:hypothetical protein
MAAAPYLSVPVCFQMRSGDDLGGQRQNVGTRQDDAVKLKLQPSFSNEVTGIFVFLKVAALHGASRKQRMSETRDRPEMAKHRIPGLRGFGREVGFVHGAVENRSGGHDFLPRGGASPDQRHGQN